MNEWIKLQPDAVIEHYLVSPEVAQFSNNHFYGRRVSGTMPVDTRGQFLGFLVNDRQNAMHFHFATLESEFHEEIVDYDPLTTPYLGQILSSDLVTIEEMAQIIIERGDKLKGDTVKRPAFQKVAVNELPFVDPISGSGSVYYKQVYNPLGDKISRVNYLIIYGQQNISMKILQVEDKLDSQEIDFNSIYTKSVNVLPLNKSGAATLSQIIQDFIVGLKNKKYRQG